MSSTVRPVRSGTLRRFHSLALKSALFAPELTTPSPTSIEWNQNPTASTACCRVSLLSEVIPSFPLVCELSIEFGETACHPGTDRFRAATRADGFCRTDSHCPAALFASGQPPQPASGLIDVGFGPELPGGVPVSEFGAESVILVCDRTDVVADEGGRPGGHEVDVAAVPGGDHGFAHGHRLGHPEAETLRAV